jgi:hypothetical protein
VLQSAEKDVRNQPAGSKQPHPGHRLHFGRGGIHIIQLHCATRASETLGPSVVSKDDGVRFCPKLADMLASARQGPFGNF